MKVTEYAGEYIEYLIEFHGTRDFFECHEIMEAYWKEQSVNEQRNAWLGLIQVAVGLYHQRTGNRNGSIKMLNGALTQLSTCDCEALGIDQEHFLHIIRERITLLNQVDTLNSFDYQDFNIPFFDHHLVETCQKICNERQLDWCGPSDMQNRQLIYRHTLRDRSDVIAARKAAHHKKHQLGGI